MPCTKALVKSVTALTYMGAKSHRKCLQVEQLWQSLLYFSELHILFSHSILHEEATLVRNMLQPTNTTDT